MSATINLGANGEGAYRRPYIGFSFGGKHSSQLNIIRTSDGSRFNEDLLPPIKDETVEVPGGDGSYYFGSHYQAKKIDIPIAFDNMSQDNFDEFKDWLGSKDLKELIFDEKPYKYYMAKISAAPRLKYIPFRQKDNSTIYKGEGTLSFTAFYPKAKSRVSNFKYFSEFVDGADIVTPENFAWVSKKMGLTQDVPFGQSLGPLGLSYRTDSLGDIIAEFPDSEINIINDPAIDFNYRITISAFLWEDSSGNLRTYHADDGLSNEYILPMDASGKMYYSIKGAESDYAEEYCEFSVPSGFGDSNVTSYWSNTYSKDTYPYYKGEYFTHELIIDSSKDEIAIYKKGKLVNSDYSYCFKVEDGIKYASSLLELNAKQTSSGQKRLALMTMPNNGKQGGIYGECYGTSVRQRVNYTPPVCEIVSSHNKPYFYKTAQPDITNYQIKNIYNPASPCDWKIIFSPWSYIDNDGVRQHLPGNGFSVLFQDSVGTGLYELKIQLDNNTLVIGIPLNKSRTGDFEFIDDFIVDSKTKKWYCGDQNGEILLAEGDWFKLPSGESSLYIWRSDTSHTSPYPVSVPTILDYAPPSIELQDQTRGIEFL